MMALESILSAINRAAVPLTFNSDDYDPLLEWIGDRELVLIGEASHGTHEFYRERALITKRLIEEKGFTSVFLEVPKWPDVLPLNQFVQGGMGTVQDALNGLDIWAAWTWGNLD